MVSGWVFGIQRYTYKTLSLNSSHYQLHRSFLQLQKQFQLNNHFYRIRYARDAETLQIAGVISTELLNHRANLAGYMVTEEHLADLQQHIEKFRKAMEIKGGVKSRRVADNKRLVRLFKSTDDLLYRKMDRLMIRLKTDYPDFFNAYQNARKIVDR